MIVNALSWLIAIATQPVHEAKGATGRQYIVHAEGAKVLTVPAPTKGQITHAFEDFGSFCSWMTKHADPGPSEILVGRQVVGGTDPQAPGSSCVTCAIGYHPAAEQWLGVLGRPLTQKRFHRLILTSLSSFGGLMGTVDGKPQVVGSEGEILAAEVAKFAMVKGGQYSAELDARGFTAVKGSNEKTEVTGRIPVSFGVTFPLHPGVEQHAERGSFEARYRLTLYIDIDVSGKEPTFTLSCPGLDLVKAEAKRDLVAHLGHLLGLEWLVGVGEYRTETVEGLTADPTTG